MPTESPPKTDQSLHYMLGKLDGKMDAVLTQTAQLSTRIDAHDKRLGVLEKWKAWVLGVATSISALVGAGASWLLTIFSH